MNEVNTKLLERADEMISYWEGTVMAELLEQDVAENDLESLYGHVLAAEAMISQQEYMNNDIF